MFCGTCNVGLLMEWSEDMSGQRLFYVFVLCATLGLVA